jgi:tRNA(fMet)-specific endonuclease VapC
MTYILDTDACIGMLRGRAPKTIAKAATIDPREICITSIVRFELLAGAERSAQPIKERVKVETFCQRFVALTFDDRAASEAAIIRNVLEKAGQKIGPYDTLIAGIARTNDLIVVTRNVAEFLRVPELRVENWEL